ncbi:MAG TPA: glycosyltransferase family 2 protein [Candidatus Udaeobacter sp.]|nr:glycosyltransferase family 2 protein [Candidatus Udaeobacter sp.]
MPTITAHCIIKNEENFVGYAIKSVIDFVDTVLVFDTGSTDKTVNIVQGLIKEYPNKIIFEEKGECDKIRHTQLHQEMVDRTKTDWFMILDGDEVWTKRAMEEVKEIIEKGSFDGIKTGFYECVGDIYHRHYKESYVTARFAKVGDAVWKGDYNQDKLCTKAGEDFFKTKNIYTLQNRFWHLTHLLRSAKDSSDYSSGGSRAGKRIKTYFFLGRTISEPVPEVFNGGNFKLSMTRSLINFALLVISRLKNL